MIFNCSIRTVFIHARWLAAMVALLPALAFAAVNPPNIVLIMTDDQGYGDIGRNQNPAVHTPNIDQLASESVRFSNFHMDPTCSPSRAALLTGKHSMRAGVWHTIMGRSLLPTEHKTLPEQLKEAGYKTAMFGKWHLGDNYPFRPEDQGFEEVLIHGGGGVGQTPDYWGNTQFGDTYYRNGKPEKFEAFATTVWFDEAIDFIHKNRDKPFFTYISTNAPHSPWRSPEAYVKPYIEMGLPKELALFYAMITHLDEQVGRLRNELEKAGIADNTLLIFATDNGSSMASSKKGQFGSAGFDGFFEKIKRKPDLKEWVYNAGMRGFKASVYEGGHRVPLYIHWPDGKLKSGRDISTLAAHFDLMPTLLDAAQIDAPEGLDGVSLVPALKGIKAIDPRTLIVTNQRVDIPSKDRPSVVMTDRWRYVLHGEQKRVELFDIQADPGQTTDLKERHPEVVDMLQQDFDQWWTEVTSKGFPRQRIVVGSDHENPARLTAMDWMEAASEREVPWFPGFQRPQDKQHSASWMGREESIRSLPWYLNFEQSGAYRVSLYLKDKPGSHPVDRQYAILEIDGKRTVAKVNGLAGGVDFELKLKKGPVQVKGWFADDKAGEENKIPAFYAYIYRK